MILDLPYSLDIFNSKISQCQIHKKKLLLKTELNPNNRHVKHWFLKADVEIFY